MNFLRICFIFEIDVVEELVFYFFEVYLFIPSIIEYITEYALGECIDRINHHGPIRDSEEEVFQWDDLNSSEQDFISLIVTNIITLPFEIVLIKFVPKHR